MKIDIRNMLQYDEGYKLMVYRCTGGYLTGGIGHNFDADPAIHIMHRKVKFGDRVSPDEAVALFEYDLGKVMMGLKKRVSFFNSSPENIKAVLINMAFQMGIDGLAKFKRMLKAMDEGDYEAAADHILDSKYAKDTPSRARRMSRLCVGLVDKHYQ